MKTLALRNIWTTIAMLAFFVAVQNVLALQNVQAQTKRTSNFNERWLDAVISIERQLDTTSVPIGTGFLVIDEDRKFALVTAAHVLLKRDEGPRQSSNIHEGLIYRRGDVGADSAVIRDEDLAAVGIGTWYFSKDFDIAVRPFGWPRGFRPVTGVPMSHFIAKESIETGAPLLILGFPMGLRSKEHARPIVRRGIIAREDSHELMVDAFVFPGNSGGPVVYVPTVKIGEMLQSPFVNEEQLIGMVVTYIPYTEAAISPQTRRTRIIFEENSGLSRIVTIDAIRQTLLDAGFRVVP